MNTVSASGRHEEGGERRGGVLHQLGEAEDPALALEGDRPLQDRLLGRLDDRDQRQPHDHADGEQDDRRPEGEDRAHEPVDEVAVEDDPQRAGAEAPAGDVQPAADEGQADEAPQQPPRLHRHQRQTVGVDQGHEDAGHQVVEGAEEDQHFEAGDGPDGLEGAAHVDVLRPGGSPSASAPGRLVDDDPGRGGPVRPRSGPASRSRPSPSPASR